MSTVGRMGKVLLLCLVMCQGLNAVMATSSSTHVPQLEEIEGSGDIDNETTTDSLFVGSSTTSLNCAPGSGICLLNDDSLGNNPGTAIQPLGLTAILVLAIVVALCELRI